MINIRQFKIIVYIIQGMDLLKKLVKLTEDWQSLLRKSVRYNLGTPVFE